MNLVSTRIITSNIKELIAFYEQISQASLVQYTPDFAELKTQFGTLAIASTKTLPLFGADKIAQPNHNLSAIIEFRVDDVDAYYARLSNYLEAYIIQKPTVLPWGNKSFLFQDPDGNLVNVFTPVTPGAIQKFDGAS